MAPLLRTALTLLLAWLAAQACVALGTPIPWMIGPLLATALASMAGLPTRSDHALRNAGQWTIGAALGLYFTPEVTALVASLWWAVALGVAWALALGAGFGVWLNRALRGQLAHLAPAERRATTYFAGAVGGASEMTLLAERAGARTDLVAAAHSVRMAVVVLSMPFAMQWVQQHWQLQALDMTPPMPRDAEWPGLLWLLLATGAGAAAMRLTGRANPWFIGPLLAAMALTMADVHLSSVPSALVNAAQLLIGVSLGVRFSRQFLRAAPRWLAAAALGTLGMMAACALFAVVLAWATGLHPVTLMLATSPGGITEMAITAKVLRLGAPVVTAFQVCRLVAVLLLVEPVYRRWGAVRPS
ncbi:AbrB family transcriptional regulator [Ottowia sp.]|uniref:AbrB family transcriptional regulator n=1 Tax=Ottowia sp. TaxID=1898956 RepID=UPI002BBA1241|nr:AbrB family transcriptional regulator [Ottowia sp.]HOB66303.1 AbrB family transcriptional regulator [Ottowia sp.]HPZ57316.1 AbrB family transcriptional regulator [Ottowia sp.]HQD47504.1 AbrB family transcriptional regulator [Ottowia sp.]